jgi:hypothetical protein
MLSFACASFLPIIVGCAVNAPSSSQQGQSSVVYARAALSGTEQRLDFFYAVHPDCTSEGYPTIRTVTQPVHGKLRVEQATDYTNFPKDNQRYECNKQRSPVVVVYYQSDLGYAGPDTAIIEVIFPSGVLRTYTFNVTVK